MFLEASYHTIARACNYLDMPANTPSPALAELARPQPDKKETIENRITTFYYISPIRRLFGTVLTPFEGAKGREQNGSILIPKKM